MLTWRGPSPANDGPSGGTHHVPGVAHAGLVAWNEERKGGAGPRVALRPEAPLMTLDERAADKQPDAHAADLGRVEGIEQRIEALRGEADAGVAHHQTHAIGALPFGSDPQLPGAIVHVEHRVRRVAE